MNNKLKRDKTIIQIKFLSLRPVLAIQNRLRGACVNRLRLYPRNLIRIMPAEEKRFLIVIFSTTPFLLFNPLARRC
jgi:hypothetical protein